MKYHPDKATGDKAKAEERFKKIAEAYEVLSDKEKKQTYDTMGKAALNGGAGMDGMNFQHAEDIFAQFFGGRDPFEVLFSQGGMGGGGMRGFQSMGGGSTPGVSFQMGGMPMGGMGGMPMGGSMGGMEGLFGQMGGMPMGGMGGMRRQRPKAQEYGAFKPGTHILVKEVKSKPFLNNTYGVIQGYEKEKDRYHVDIEDYGIVSLSSKNVQQLIRNVTIHGLKSKPQYNMQKGILYDYDGAKKRSLVHVGNDNLSLQSENIIFPEGTCVELLGLSKGVQYNGRRGTITEVDTTKGRYTVFLSANERLSIKFSNVKP